MGVSTLNLQGLENVSGCEIEQSMSMSMSSALYSAKAWDLCGFSAHWIGPSKASVIVGCGY